MKTATLTLLLLMILTAGCKQKKVFTPDLKSLEQYEPAPEWFNDAKFGIYFHWGVYSVPAFGNEWYPRNMYAEGSIENIHHKEVYGTTAEWPYDNFIKGSTDRQGNFVKFEPKLKSEGGNFDPKEWADLFYRSGAKFAGPVAEHHDGFSMWASRVNPWNAADMGPKKDLVKLLTDAIREKNMKVILSMHHAFNITGFYEKVPLSADSVTRILYGQQGKEKNEELWLAKLKEVIDGYRPDILWQDFNLPAISQDKLLEFLAYYYNRSEEWGTPVVATYKDALNEKVAMLDFERGGPADVRGNYWLTDDAISKSSWCYTEGIGYYSPKQVLHGFFDRISKNGNLLLNISPKPDGSIPQEQKDILLAMGDWLGKYGEAVYGTRAWDIYGEGPTKMGRGHQVFTEPAEGTEKDIRFTRSKDMKTLYAIVLGWPEESGMINITSLASGLEGTGRIKKVELLSPVPGKYTELNYFLEEDGLKVSLPEKPGNELAYVIKISFKGSVPSIGKGPAL